MSLAVRVPASTSNLGAGFHCLGLALDLWLEARLVEGSGDPMYRGTLGGLDPAHDLIARALRAEGISNELHLEVRSEIPVGKGLGSSGAAVVAGLALAGAAAARFTPGQAAFVVGHLPAFAARPERDSQGGFGDIESNGTGARGSSGLPRSVDSPRPDLAGCGLRAPVNRSGFGRATVMGDALANGRSRRP